MAFSQKYADLIRIVRLAIGTSALTVATIASAQQADERPNFVLIVADDLGFSDLGSFGGEIKTPNLDRLAQEGVRYTNFYVGASCSPTRSMLMTGNDNHRVGMGNMYERTAPNQMDLAGYEGVLRRNFPTFAELLKGAGYRTYMTGKWHLGHEPDLIPRARGFDRDFTLLNSGGSHFDLTGLRIENEESEFTRDGRYTRKLPKNYYSTRTFTDEMIGFLEADRDQDSPFVAYLAYQAPHDPLQVPDDWLRRYKGKFDYGWDRLRSQRLARLKQMGLISPEAELAPRLWFVPEFDDLTKASRATTTRKMEIYASVVEYLDWQIGRMIDYLEETGELENTIILFMSDNGPEGADPIPAAKRQPNLESSSFFFNNYETHFNAWGRDYGFVAYGAPWAQVSATPFNGYKGAVYEGGIRSPLIVWQPSRERAGSINSEALLHVMDVAPTLLDLAGVDHSAMQGLSWAEMLSGRRASPRGESDIIAMQMFGAMMVRRGDWKAVMMPEPIGAGRWELFNLARDPGETNDVSAQHPDRLAVLIQAWDEYARANNVILPNRTPYDGLADRLPPKPPVVSPGWPRGQEQNWIDRSGNKIEE